MYDNSYISPFKFYVTHNHTVIPNAVLNQKRACWLGFVQDRCVFCLLNDNFHVSRQSDRTGIRTFSSGIIWY